MKKYFESVKGELKEYFDILSPEKPDFLEDYLLAPELQRIGKISMFCGKDYSASYGVKYPVSNLDHSVGVALIIWHFTKNKKQTLAGLFHDIATPTFKHCIDFMNGDELMQESTEELTETIIKNSNHIMSLLEKDNIKLEEVSDYKKYTIADNKSPRLSADRFEYNFTCGLSLKRVFDLNFIRQVYADIEIGTNEDGEDELAFRHVDIAEDYIDVLKNLWPEWVNERNNVYMKFLGDICKAMNQNGELEISDLYTLSEQEVINKIKNSKNENIRTAFNKFLECKKIEVLDKPKRGMYCVKTNVKRRYVCPLVRTTSGFKRVTEISDKAKETIDRYTQTPYDKYGCLDFDFKF